MRTRLAALASAMLTLPAAGPTPAGPETLQRCVAAIADRADLSGEVLVTRGGRTIARLYRGVLAEPGSAAVDRDTRFNLGSASKMFTAVAIGQLIERGRLRLDEPVGEVVAGLTPAAGRVTIRELLDHTSGLGDFFQPQNMEAMLRARTAADILPLISRETPAFEPGSRFAYSNSGFALLGIAIERTSGMSYGEYLHHNVFVPAGMTRTGLDPLPLRTLAVGMTQGGMRAAGGGPPPGSAAPTAPPGAGLVLIGPDGRRVDPASVAASPPTLRRAPGATEGYGSPAGGLFSTAEDMDRFASALRTGRLLSHRTFAEFSSPQVEASPPSGDRPARHYGFGFGLADDGGMQWVGHNGGTLGANAEFWFAPREGWTVTVLTNRDPPVATDVVKRIRPLIASAQSGTCA